MALLPPSKSHVLRVLLVAAAARRRVTLSYPASEGWEGAGDDIRRGFDCARALGCEVVVRGGECAVEPVSPVVAGGALPVGESGFLGRVAPTCAAMSRPGRWEVEAVGSLKHRLSAPLWDCLRGAGVDVEVGEGWLSSLEAPDELKRLELSDPCSSQELSALWIGLAASGGGEVRVHGDVPSEPYLALTRDVLSSFGSTVGEFEGGFAVTPVTMEPPGVVSAEPDASAAAVALAAGCLGGVRVEVPAPAPGSAQGDWRIVEHLRAFGCEIDTKAGRLVAAGGPTHGAELDLSGEPDLAPVLAAVACRAAQAGGGGSSLTGLHTLECKESRRGSVLERGLQRAGYACDWRENALTVGQNVEAVAALTLDPVGDHRMAFAFALLGIFMPEVSVGCGACTAKSWPNFWSALAGGVEAPL